MSEANQKLTFSIRSKTTKRSLVIVLILLIILYGIIPNLHSLFGIDVHLHAPKNWLYLVLALIAYFSNYLLTSISYRLLALKRIRLLKIFIVQLASSSLNILLPDGLGGISLNYLFLRAKGLTQSSSALAVGLNNSIGILGNITMLVLLLAVFGANHSLLKIFDKHERSLVLIVLIAVLVVMILTLFLTSAFSLARKLRRNLFVALKRYHGHWLHLVGPYLCSLAQASVTAFAFWLSLRAFNIDLAYPLAFLIYSLSVLVGGFFPTPGGLGGVEASMVAGIVAVHGSSTGIALSTVLAFRVISYWLPVVLGSMAFLTLKKMNLLEQS